MPKKTLKQLGGDKLLSDKPSLAYVDQAAPPLQQAIKPLSLNINLKKGASSMHDVTYSTSPGHKGSEITDSSSPSQGATQTKFKFKQLTSSAGQFSPKTASSASSKTMTYLNSVAAKHAEFKSKGGAQTLTNKFFASKSGNELNFSDAVNDADLLPASYFNWHN